MTTEFPIALIAISDGPSKWDLMLGLFDNTASSPRQVTFRLDASPREQSELGASWLAELPMTIEVSLNSLQREDGSGESWNFQGHVRHLGVYVGEADGYFSTKHRRGAIHLPVLTHAEVSVLRQRA